MGNEELGWCLLEKARHVHGKGANNQEAVATLFLALLLHLRMGMCVCAPGTHVPHVWVCPCVCLVEWGHSLGLQGRFRLRQEMHGSTSCKIRDDLKTTQAHFTDGQSEAQRYQSHTCPPPIRPGLKLISFYPSPGT